MDKHVIKECKHHGQTGFVLEGRGYYRCQRCRQDAVANRRKKVLATLKGELGGKCQICGYDRYIGALEFHHLNRSDKQFILSRGHTFGIDKMREEAAKCALLCSNCHKEVEAGEAVIPG